MNELDQELDPKTGDTQEWTVYMKVPLGLLHLKGYGWGEDFFKHARREGGSKR